MQLGALEYLISVNNKGVQQGIDQSERMIKSSAGRTERDLKAYGDKISSWTIAKGQMIANVMQKSVKMLASTTTNLVKSSINAFAQFEQINEGAKLVWGEAFGEIEKNAKKAYKNVQMSAVEYMEQANFYAVGLKESLNGDSKAAAKLADNIITAQADIVAALGIDADRVQNAFNGIMRGNYTMLDNLGLGIAGTKKGMEEVIKKVNEWNKAQGKQTNYSMKSLADQQQALVDYVQMQNLAGYAASEGTNTIQGALASTKAAWKDLLTSFGNGKDFRGATKRFTESLKNVVKNVTPVARTSIKSIISSIKDALPDIKGTIKDIWNDLKQDLPKNNIFRKIQEKVEGLMGFFDLLTSLITNFPETMKALETSDNPLLQGFGDFVSMAKLLVDKIDEGIKSTDSLLAGLLVGVGDFVTEAILKISDWLTDEGNLSAIESAFESIGKAIITSLEKIFISPAFFNSIAILGHNLLLAIVGEDSWIGQNIIGGKWKQGTKTDPTTGNKTSIIVDENGNDVGTTGTEIKDKVVSAVVAHRAFKVAKPLVDRMLHAATDTGTAAQGTQVAKETIQAAMNNLDSTVNDLYLHTIEEYGDDFGEAVIQGSGDATRVVAEGADDATKTVWQIIKDGFKNAKNAVNNKLIQYGTSFNPATFFNGMAMSDAFFNYTQLGRSIMNSVSQWITGEKSTPDTNLGEYFEEKGEEIKKNASTFFTDWGTTIGSLIGGEHSNIAEIGKSIGEYFDGQVKTAFANAKETFESLKKGIEDWAVKVTRKNVVINYAETFTGGSVFGSSNSIISGTGSWAESTTTSPGGRNNIWVKEKKAKGDFNVAHDMIAQLHQGEIVLTKSQARRYREGENADYMVIGSMIGSAIENAMSRVYVMMSGEKVGDLTTRRIKKNLNANSYSKLRALGG